RRGPGLAGPFQRHARPLLRFHDSHHATRTRPTPVELHLQTRAHRHRELALDEHPARPGLARCRSLDDGRALVGDGRDHGPSVARTRPRLSFDFPLSTGIVCAAWEPWS